MALLFFTDPNHEDLFNWGRDIPLVYVARVGQLPIAQDTEMDTNELGGPTFRTFRVYALCTVHIDRDGYLQVEFYEGSTSGNPEDGERVTVYYKQCASVGDARVEARMALEDADGILSADYFLGLGFEKEVL